MAAERALTKMQYGKETTSGTAVAATKYLLAAPMALPQDKQVHFPTDQMGIRARSGRAQNYEYLARGTVQFDNEHPLYYQALPLLFSCGVKGGVTASEATGGQSDYLWTFTPTLTASNTPDSVTLEVGDDTQAFEMEYLQFERIRIAGQIAQDGAASPVTCDADFYARQVSATTFTGALTLPTVEPINAKLMRFYLDTAWASVGTTEKTGTLRSFDIEILTGLHPKFMGGANKYFDVHGQGYIDVMANLVLEGNATADAIWDAYQARTLQVLRFIVSGAQIGTGTYYNMTLDVGGYWESVEPLGGESNGNNLHNAVFHGVYDVTGAKLLQLLVTTNANTV